MSTAIDDSGRALLGRVATWSSISRHVAWALLSLVVGFIASRAVVARLFDDRLDAWQLATETVLIVVVVGGGAAATAVLPFRRQLLGVRERIAEHEESLRTRNESQRFLRGVQNAFDMADFEEELFGITSLALRDAGPGSAEILVADASRAHVTRLVVTEGREPPGCGVTTPHNCPAVRRGQTLRFAEPNGLESCPRLRERRLDDGLVATCIPVTVLGSPAAVVHAVVDQASLTEADLRDGVRSLEGVATRFGARLGMLRAMSQSKLQADTDPLTGLLNRRAMENQVRSLRTEGAPFALAMVDLDHFKDLNDTYGHDTGDRALRLFARVMTSVVRDHDIVSRHGGEEFVIVLPGTDAASAAPVLHRIRERLKDHLASAQLPAFTASIGLVDSTWSDDLVELLRAADRALLEAKLQGRDRLVIDDPPELVPVATG